jgi:hypothetical protein
MNNMIFFYLVKVIHFDSTQCNVAIEGTLSGVEMSLQYE